MARFFRAVFSLMLVLYLIIMLALFIPPLIGVSTVTTTYNTEGNQAVGTVDYSVRKPLNSISAGDKILVADSSSVNVYTVQSIDADNSTVMVNTGSGMQELTVKSYVQKLLTAVPIIGFITIILQSAAGFLVLGLTAVLLVLLVILMSIRCKKDKVRRNKQAMSRKERKQKESMEKYREPRKERPISDPVGSYRPMKPNDSMSGNASDSNALGHTTVFSGTRIQEKLPELDEEYEDFPPKEPVIAAPIIEKTVQQESKPAVTKTIAPVKADIPDLPADKEMPDKEDGLTSVLRMEPKSDQPVLNQSETDQHEEEQLVLDQLAEADIVESDIKESDIKESNIEDSNTEDSNTEESNTEDSNTEDSNIEESNIEGSNIEEPDIKEPTSDKSDVEEEEEDQSDDDMSELAVSDMILASVQETDICDYKEETPAAVRTDEQTGKDELPVIVQEPLEPGVDTDVVSEVVRDAVQDIVVDKVVEVEKSSVEGDDASPQQIMLTINIKVV